MKKTILKAIAIIAIFIMIYLICTSFFVYPTIAEGMSMFPAIAPNEIKLTNRWKVITKQELRRNDIILFEEPSILYVEPDKFDIDNVKATYDSNFHINLFRKRWMKRIIGLPNDHIQITKGNELYRNGEKLGYANKSGQVGEDYSFIDIIVPENCVYVMGDNRTESTDSRSFGCIPIEKIYSILF